MREPAGNNLIPADPPMKLLIHRTLPPRSLEKIQQIAPDAEIRVEPNPNALDPLLDWAEVILGNVSASRLLHRPQVRWLQIVSSGFDEYLPLASSSITVTTAHGVHAQTIAHHVVMAMLMFARGQLHFGDCQRQHKWDRTPTLPFSLVGQTVGILGYGAIGQELCKLTHALGMKAVALRRSQGPRPPELTQVFSGEQLEGLLQQSDHVVITLPLTSATRGILSATRVAQLKPGAYVYNIARGGLVDESALRGRLQAGTLGGAAMDVFAEEPLSETSPWWDSPRTLITPHLAGHHRSLGDATLEVFIQNLQRYLKKQPLLNQADFSRGY